MGKMDSKTIIRHYMISTLIFSILGAFISPIYIYYQGQLFKPEQLSLLFMITSSMGCLQILMNKVNTKVSLFMPHILNTLLMVTVLILLINGNVKMYIIVNIVGGTIVSMLMIHYSGMIQEILKMDIQIQKIQNLIVTLSEVGAVIGYGIGTLILYRDKYLTILIIGVTIEILLEGYSFYISLCSWKYNEKKKLATHKNN